MDAGHVKLETLLGDVFEGSAPIGGEEWVEGLEQRLRSGAFLAVVVRDDGSVVAVPVDNVHYFEYVPAAKPAPVRRRKSAPASEPSE